MVGREIRGGFVAEEKCSPPHPQERNKDTDPLTVGAVPTSHSKLELRGEPQGNGEMTRSEGMEEDMACAVGILLLSSMASAEGQMLPPTTS